MKKDEVVFMFVGLFLVTGLMQPIGVDPVFDATSEDPEDGCFSGIDQLVDCVRSTLSTVSSAIGVVTGATSALESVQNTIEDRIVEPLDDAIERIEESRWAPNWVAGLIRGPFEVAKGVSDSVSGTIDQLGQVTDDLKDTTDFLTTALGYLMNLDAVIMGIMSDVYVQVTQVITEQFTALTDMVHDTMDRWMFEPVERTTDRIEGWFDGITNSLSEVLGE